MSRPVLRLVQPLNDAMDFPEGRGESVGLRGITSVEEIHSYLQLFLMWPDYSSSFIKVDGEITKVTVSVDQGLSEFEQLYISTDEQTFNKIKKNPESAEKIFVEVFGITFGFRPVVQECIDEYVVESPCISILLPGEITRYNLRGTRRVKVSDNHTITILSSGKSITGNICDVSPSSLSFRSDSQLEENNPTVTVIFEGSEFDVLAKQSLNKTIVLSPIVQDPNHFGKYFDLYLKFAYPMLRSRYHFAEDPIPKLMDTTGQAKKFAEREVSSKWLENISEAYTASSDVVHDYTSDYVAVNDDGLPIATSSLAKAFVDVDHTSIWSFHGLGSVQDPKYLEHICAIYNWRSDYLIAKDPKGKLVFWFDGKGRWLEKVYTKFYHLTSETTKLWIIRNNRYVRTSDFSKFEPAAHNKDEIRQIEIKKGRFTRVVGASKTISYGTGVPYLNYSGVLENFFVKEKDEQAAAHELTTAVLENCPERFFIPTPCEFQDLKFSGFDMFCLEATTRQCLTTVEALKCFSTSLEHSKAVLKKKYAA